MKEFECVSKVSCLLVEQSTDVICSKCGRVIPAGEPSVEFTGDAKGTEDGKAIHEEVKMCFCQECKKADEVKALRKRGKGRYVSPEILGMCLNVKAKAAEPSGDEPSGLSEETVEPEKKPEKKKPKRITYEDCQREMLRRNERVAAPKPLEVDTVESGAGQDETESDEVAENLFNIFAGEADHGEAEPEDRTGFVGVMRRAENMLAEMHRVCNEMNRQALEQQRQTKEFVLATRELQRMTEQGKDKALEQVGSVVEAANGLTEKADGLQKTAEGLAGGYTDSEEPESKARIAMRIGFVCLLIAVCAVAILKAAPGAKLIMQALSLTPTDVGATIITICGGVGLCIGACYILVLGMKLIAKWFIDCLKNGNQEDM